jgi:hypothetical protein
MNHGLNTAQQVCCSALHPSRPAWLFHVHARVVQLSKEPAGGMFDQL